MEGCWRKEVKNQSVKWSWGKNRMVKRQWSQDRVSVAKSGNIIWMAKHLIWFHGYIWKLGTLLHTPLWFFLKFKLWRGRASCRSQWLQSWSLFCTGLLAGDAGHGGCAYLRGTLLSTGGSRNQEYKKSGGSQTHRRHASCIYKQTNLEGKDMTEPG